MLHGEAVDRHILIVQGAAILAVCWEFRQKLLHVAFVSALAATKMLLRYVSRHSFAAFAWYRIVFGGVILVTVFGGVVNS